LAAYRLQLLPGEHVLVDIRPHWSFLSAPLAAAIVAIALGVALDIGIPHTSVALHWVEGLVVAVPCVWLALRAVRWRTTGLMLTSVRVIERWGALSRHQVETRLAQIESVMVIQSLPRRMVGTGRLELGTIGGEEIHAIDDVRKPLILQRVINRRIGQPPVPGAGPL
jgi:uncharacterized membrane protein YdbT with pleckstrin-like domain